jgi:hypothetical protein
MKTVVQLPPILNLPSDHLSAIMMQLPAVNRVNPWRDVMSLASTCKMLNKQINDTRSEGRRIYWPKCPEGATWCDQLDLVLAAADGLGEKRIFSEPILRFLTEKIRRVDSKINCEISIDDVWMRIFEKRESLRLEEIVFVLKKLTNKNPEQHYSTLKNLMNHLGKINGEHKWRALFIIVDEVMLRPKKITKDQRKNLLRQAELILQKGGVTSGSPSSWATSEEIILKRRGDTQFSGATERIQSWKDMLDVDSGVLLAIYKLKHFLNSQDAYESCNLGSRGRANFNVKETIGEMSCLVKRIPWEFRFRLFSNYAPEIFGSIYGVYFLVKDVACNEKIINYLSHRFLESENFRDRVFLCGCAALSGKAMYRHENGQALYEELGEWFVKQSKEAIFSRGYSEAKPYLSTLVDFLYRLPGNLNKKWFHDLQNKVALCFDELIKTYDELKKPRELSRNLIKATEVYVSAIKLISSAIHNDSRMVPSIDPDSNQFIGRLDLMCFAIRITRSANSPEVWFGICRQISIVKIKDKIKRREAKKIMADAIESLPEEKRKIAKSRLSKLK